jgi:toxin FitB
VFLIDTNVLSEFRLLQDGRGNTNVASWALLHDPDSFYISAVTIMETEIGIRRMERRDPHQGRILRDWMMGAVLPRYASRILAVDQQVAAIAASFHVPDPAPFADSMIAATAIMHQLTIVTRNTRNFQFPGVTVINPWDA